jgi:NAD(P)H-flavin reductase
MSTPQLYTATLNDKFAYNQRYIKLKFELKEPHRFVFEAGQYISLKINEKVSKDYFIFSEAQIDHSFEILLDVGAGENAGLGEGMQFLYKLRVGDTIKFTGPAGELGNTLAQGEELIFVATGVGMAPFRSMILDLLQAKKDQRPITLYWGMEDVETFFLEDEFEELSENFSNFKFHPVLSKAIPEWSLCRGSVFDCLSVHEVNADAHFYLSTSAQMNERLKKLFLENEVKSSQIHVSEYNI